MIYNVYDAFFLLLVKKINGEILYISTSITHLFLIWENSCLPGVPTGSESDIGSISFCSPHQEFLLRIQFF